METIVVLMGLANLREVVERLVAAGRDPHTPAACIERGTMPQQRVVTGNLETIANLADQAKLESPATTVIGEVVRQAALCPSDLGQTSILNQTLHPLPRSASQRAASA
jgi:siroheme synthase